MVNNNFKSGNNTLINSVLLLETFPLIFHASALLLKLAVSFHFDFWTSGQQKEK